MASKIEQIQQQILSGSTNINGLSVLIWQTEDRRYMANITGKDFAIAFESPTIYNPPGILSFSWDLAVKICDLL